MADLSTLDEVLEEVTSDEFWDDEEYVQGLLSSPDFQVDTPLVRNVLVSLGGQSTTAEAVKKRLLNLQADETKLQLVVTELAFVATCLPALHAAFKPALRESPIQRFHKQLLEHLPALKRHIGCGATAAFLAQGVFEEALVLAYPTAVPEAGKEHVITAEEEDIIEYYGGSALRSLLKRYRRQGKTNEVDIIYCLGNRNATIQNGSSEQQHQDMTSVLNRGGLIRPFPNIKYMFIVLEVEFRNFSQDLSSDLKLDKFLERCWKNDQVTLCFYEQVYDAEGTDEEKRNVLNSLLTVVFNIRIHNRCRRLMDDFRRKTGAEKREKALRRKLKKAAQEN